MREPLPIPVARLASGTSFPSLDRYFEGLKEMADIVGVDHVSIGTDQHVTPGSVRHYTQWVHLVAAMLRGARRLCRRGRRQDCRPQLHAHLWRSGWLKAVVGGGDPRGW
jgi:hypothetical protein